MTGIIGALESEIASIVREMTVEKIEPLGCTDFYAGRWCGREIVVCRSGVGKVAAAFAASVMAVYYRADVIINTGVAGGTVKRGSLVISDKLVQHDVRAYADDLPPGQIEGFSDLYFHADPALRDGLARAAERCGVRPIVGTIASGDQFVCDSQTVGRIKESFGAKAVDMESAAVAQVCALTGARFAALRTVTDNADETAVGDFYELVLTAAQTSLRVLKEYLTAA